MSELKTNEIIKCIEFVEEDFDVNETKAREQLAAILAENERLRARVKTLEARRRAMYGYVYLVNNRANKGGASL